VSSHCMGPLAKLILSGKFSIPISPPYRSMDTPGRNKDKALNPSINSVP